MTRPPVRCDEGGEAPCFAHLLDGSWEIPDAQVGGPTGTSDPPLDDPTEPPDRELGGPAAVNRDVTERRPASAGGRHHDAGSSATPTRNVAVNGEPDAARA